MSERNEAKIAELEIKLKGLKNIYQAVLDDDSLLPLKYGGDIYWLEFEIEVTTFDIAQEYHIYG